MSEDVFYKILLVFCLAWSASRLVKYFLIAKKIETSKNQEQIIEENRKRRIDDLYGR